MFFILLFGLSEALLGIFVLSAKLEIILKQILNGIANKTLHRFYLLG